MIVDYYGFHCSEGNSITFFADASTGIPVLNRRDSGRRALPTKWNAFSSDVCMQRSRRRCSRVLTKYWRSQRVVWQCSHAECSALRGQGSTGRKVQRKCMWKIYTIHASLLLTSATSRFRSVYTMLQWYLTSENNFYFNYNSMCQMTGEDLFPIGSTERELMVTIRERIGFYHVGLC